MKLAHTLLLTLVIGGCAHSPPPVKVQELFTPELVSVNTRELGDTLVSYRYAVVKPSFRILEYPNGGESQWFEPGLLLEPIGIRDDIQIFRNPAFATPAICRKVSTDQWSLGDSGGSCGNVNFLIFNFKLKTKSEDWVDVYAPNIRKEFIYNGRIDNYVKFTYREFSAGGIARDAFTQDVQYDLNEGNVIGFKGSRIEILKATNRVITYRVLSHLKGVNL